MTLTVLATGFGVFPGVRHNPTVDLIAALRRREARFARFGIKLETRVLPVLHAEIAQRLAKLAAEIAPDAILHFGLASRRKSISVETRARNRVSRLYSDAGGRCARELSLVPGGVAIAKARIPATQIVAALRSAGIASHLSQNAGTYLCNAAFYYSLVAPNPASVGFIHIPWPAARRYNRGSATHSSSRPAFARIVKAAEIAILEVARAARRDRLAR